MMTLEEAKEIASTMQEHFDSYDSWSEREKGFRFSCSSKINSDGCWCVPIIVWKENGRAEYDVVESINEEVLGSVIGEELTEETKNFICIGWDLEFSVYWLNRVITKYPDKTKEELAEMFFPESTKDILRHEGYLK